MLRERRQTKMLISGGARARARRCRVDDSCAPGYYYLLYGFIILIAPRDLVIRRVYASVSLRCQGVFVYYTAVVMCRRFPLCVQGNCRVVVVFLR